MNNTHLFLRRGLLVLSVLMGYFISSAQLFQLDQTFTVGQGFDGSVYSIDVQPDGKIIVGGTFNNYNSQPCAKIARLNTNGTLDNTFTSPIVPRIDSMTHQDVTSVNAVKITPNGQILVAGVNLFFIDSTTLGEGIVSWANFTRVNSNGSLDLTFSNNFFQSTYGQLGFPPGPAFNFVLQGDGSIIFSLIAGIVKLGNNGSAIATTCGSPETMGYSGPIQNLPPPFVYDGSAIGGGGAMFVFDNSSSDIFAFGVIDSVRSNTTVFDRKNEVLFDNNLCVQSANHVVDSVVTNFVQISSNSYFIGGRFQLYDNHTANQAAVIDNTGNFNSSFLMSQNLSSGGIRSSAFIDNKLLLGVDNGDYQGTVLNSLAVFNIDGSYDAANSAALNPNNSVTAIAYDSTSTRRYVYCGGDFLTFNGQSSPRIVRLQRNPLGINELPGNQKLVAYLSGESTIIKPLNCNISLLHIYDIQGKLVEQHSALPEGSTLKLTFVAGNYFMEGITTEGVVIHERFVQP